MPRIAQYQSVPEDSPPIKTGCDYYLPPNGRLTGPSKLGHLVLPGTIKRQVAIAQRTGFGQRPDVNSHSPFTELKSTLAGGDGRGIG